MKLFTDKQYQQLLQNGSAENRDCDHFPVVKLFTPDASAIWLLSQIDPDDLDYAFGLCDPGFGIPDLGNIYLPELAALRGRLGLPVERDLHFTATHPLIFYYKAILIRSGFTADEADALASIER